MKRLAGFTLIEVLVALVIVAIGMAALLSSISSSASTVSYLRDKTLAEWVALNKVADQRLKIVTPNQLPSDGTTTGDVDFAGRSWHWRQDVVKTMVQGMKRIDVKVRPAEFKGDDDSGWFVTVSGLVGDAVAPPMIIADSYGTVDAGAAGTTPLGGNNGGVNGNNAPVVSPGSTTTHSSLSSTPSELGGSDSSGSTPSGSDDSSTSPPDQNP